MDTLIGIYWHRLVEECFWLLLLLLLLLERTADDRRRRRSRGMICGRRIESRCRSRFLFHRRLLVNGEELAFFAQPDTVFAATLGIVGGNETSDFATAAVDCSLAGKDNMTKRISLPHATEVR